MLLFWFFFLITVPEKAANPRLTNPTSGVNAINYIFNKYSPEVKLFNSRNLKNHTGNNICELRMSFFFKQLNKGCICLLL